MKADRPSSTALLIAAGLLFLRNERDGAKLVSRQSADRCIQFLRTAGGLAAIVPDLVDRPWFRRTVRVLERVTIPGILAHYALRKRYLQDWVTRNVRDGYLQVVELGAGFDTFSVELHARLPEVCFIEVDHPATQRVKLRALRAMGLAPRNVFFAPADLSRTPLREVLSACSGYVPGRKTLFVAEGLLMYLEAERVSGLLECVSHEGPSRVAFTFLEPAPGGKPNFRIGSRLVDGWLRARSERFRWGVKRTELAAFLSACGLRLAEVTDDDSFARSLTQAGMVGDAPAVGEYICAAEAKP